MSRILLSLALVCLTFLLSPTLGAAAADTVTHDIQVTGSGVSTYPAFSASVGRFAITNTSATEGSLTVTATTSDPAGEVRINGRPAPGGVLTLTGLQSGDEIAVFIVDSSGTARHTFIYLPADFPRLSRDSSVGADAPSPGMVMLTLGLWTQPSQFFETAVDANGVPAVAEAFVNSMDLKRQPNGNYSVARGVGLDEGGDIVELDAQFHEIARHRTVGLTHTDGHDSILLPDGSRYLLAYEPNPGTGKTDAIIQHIGADDEVLFQWSSAPYAAETVVGASPDYAHVNSIEIMEDGDLLVSFRHFSSVFKIARTTHDGYTEGQVIWKLGGRDSDFTFVDTEGEADGGPCAQHTAKQLPNGNIMVFDNGAWNLNPLCIDPADPTGPLVPRVPTRIAEWSLDPETGVATMVHDFTLEDRYAIFAGSAQPLDNGNTMIGWASATGAVASEVDETGALLWDLKAVDSPKYFTYRAFKTDVPDTQAPAVSVTSPANGATFAQGAKAEASYECTDRGGSSLKRCAATPIDTTTPGSHTATVSALDGAGNQVSVERTYTVTPGPVVPPAPTTPPPGAPASYQPDATIKAAGAGGYRGRTTYSTGTHQQLTSVLNRVSGAKVAVVRIHNDGSVPDQFSVRGFGSSKKFRVRLRFPDGQRTSPLLQPGETWIFRVKISAKSTARPGNVVTKRLVATSLKSPGSADAVRFRVKVG